MARSKYRETWAGNSVMCPTAPHHITVTVDVVVDGERRQRRIGCMELDCRKPLMTETGNYLILFHDMQTFHRRSTFKCGVVQSIPAADFNPWLLLREALDEIGKRLNFPEKAGFNVKKQERET